MLILFDIDLTLISTFGSGMLALEQAGKDLFGPSFTIKGVEFAGRLDPLIIDDLLPVHRQAVSKEPREAMRRGVELSPRAAREISQGPCGKRSVPKLHAAAKHEPTRTTAI